MQRKVAYTPVIQPVQPRKLTGLRSRISAEAARKNTHEDLLRPKEKIKKLSDSTKTGLSTALVAWQLTDFAPKFNRQIESKRSRYQVQSRECRKIPMWYSSNCDQEWTEDQESRLFQTPPMLKKARTSTTKGTHAMTKKYITLSQKKERLPKTKPKTWWYLISLSFRDLRFRQSPKLSYAKRILNFWILSKTQKVKETGQKEGWWSCICKRNPEKPGFTQTKRNKNTHQHHDSQWHTW